MVSTLNCYKEELKTKLRGIYVSCTKADVRMNNLMSRARPTINQVSTCSPQVATLNAFLNRTHAGPWRSSGPRRLQRRKPKQKLPLSPQLLRRESGGKLLRVVMVRWVVMRPVVPSPPPKKRRRARPRVVPNRQFGFETVCHEGDHRSLLVFFNTRILGHQFWLDV